jgi:hypothetical protein
MKIAEKEKNLNVIHELNSETSTEKYSSTLSEGNTSTPRGFKTPRDSSEEIKKKAPEPKYKSRFEGMIERMGNLSKQEKVKY